MIKKTRDLAREMAVHQRTIQRWLQEGWKPDNVWRTRGGHYRIGDAPKFHDLDLATQTEIMHTTIELAAALKNALRREEPAEPTRSLPISFA